MRRLAKLILPLYVLFWMVLGMTAEPFRSHPWLTMLCAPASLMALLLGAGFTVWLKRRNRGLQSVRRD